MELLYVYLVSVSYADTKFWFGIEFSNVCFSTLVFEVKRLQESSMTTVLFFSNNFDMEDVSGSVIQIYAMDAYT